MGAGKTVPTGVKVISVLYYIGAALSVLLGLFLFGGAGMINSISTKIPLLGVLGAGLFVVGGIILILLGVLYFFIARGLWNLKSWARTIAIILAALGALGALGSILSGHVVSNIISLAISIAIGAYLLFSEEVKQAFA